MQRYDYLIVGAGMTAHAAVTGIREVDSAASVAVIGAETVPPYFRPPLSKALWQGKSVDQVWCGTAGQRAEVITAREVVSVDAAAHRARDNCGEDYEYGTLLLATGGSPRTVPGDAAEGVVYYRALDDYYRVRELVDNGAQHIVVIGAGFIGSEMAAALAMNEVTVTMLFPESGVGALMFPRELSDFLNQYYQDRGVRVMPGHGVSRIRGNGNGYEVLTEQGATVQADAVVAGLGINPNTALATSTGLKVDNGILVDEWLRTSAEGIYAAGDAANFYNPLLNRRLRVEHDDNTQTMGRMAGMNMAGSQQRYDYLPMFYSDLFDLGYEAVGETLALLDSVSYWEQFGRKGIVCYREDFCVRGVVFWNVWDMVEEGREWIGQQEPMDYDRLKQWYRENGG